MNFYDIDPQDIDPDTGRPYPGYSSPSLDTSFHDREMSVDETPEERSAQYGTDPRDEAEADQDWCDEARA